MTGRELGLVREALTAAGMDISYAYEDLVFPEHNGFLLQFSDDPHTIKLHINIEANEDELATAISLLELKGAEIGLTLKTGSKYCMRQLDDRENITLEFY